MALKFYVNVKTEEYWIENSYHFSAFKRTYYYFDKLDHQILALELRIYDFSISDCCSDCTNDIESRLLLINEWPPKYDDEQ